MDEHTINISLSLHRESLATSLEGTEGKGSGAWLGQKLMVRQDDPRQALEPKQEAGTGAELGHAFLAPI